MKMMHLICVLLAFFALGCLDDAIQGMKDDLKPTNFTLNSSYDIMEYANGTCLAMVCKNKTALFPFSLFIDSSIAGGNCSLVPMNESEYNKTINGANDLGSIRFFMYGAGHSFLSFSDANLYCNNSLKMSVKWLTGGAGTPYTMPDRKRAECFLDKNILPVYLLYSNSTNIDAQRAGDVAAALNGAGPAIIVSEAELDDSNPSNYPLVESQLAAMRQNCPKCLIALGVKLNGSSEYNVTEAMLSDSAVLHNVDLVAYGLNSHSFTECNPDLLYWYAMNYSKSVLQKYNKPSLITYVLFDAANSSDNSCTWLDATVANGYAEMFSQLQALVSDGIIGASLYSFYGGGPLVCENCAFVNPNLGSACNYNFVPQKVEPKFSVYMGFCRAYYSGIEGDITGVQPLVFSNGSVGCSYALNSNLINYLRSTSTDMTAFGSTTIEKSKPFFTCAGCFDNGGNPPTHFTSVPPALPEFCTLYNPSVEIAADNFDMDPMLLRAAIWQESTFNPNKASYVPVTNRGCNKLNLLEVPDPDNCANPEKQYIDNSKLGDPVTPCRNSSQIAPGNQGEECKPCAYGLGQAIEYPSYIYRENNLPYDPAVIVCASNSSNGVPDFNSYRPYDSACVYAYKYASLNLPVARNLVSTGDNAAKLGVQGTDDSTQNTREWYAALLALDNVFGHQKKGCYAASESQQDWIDHFAAQKDRDDCASTGVTLPCGSSACCGETDFLKFMKNCEHKGDFSYGYDVLAKYYSLRESCDNPSCPDSKNGDKSIVEYLCTSGYMESNCCSAAKVAGFYSANFLCFLNPNTPASCVLKYCQGALPLV